MKDHRNNMTSKTESRFGRTLFLPFLVVLIGASLAGVFIITKPTSTRVAVESPATPVQTIVAKSSEEQVRISQSGTVVAAQEVSIRPQVSGKIIEQNAKLIPGGHFSAGEVMLKIDPRDYQNIVEQKKSQVETALFQLKEEQGRQLVAEKEWSLLENDIPTTKIGKQLALRTAHARKSRAILEAARSALKQAELDLERTTLKAPFNAFIQSESVDIGQLVTPQMDIARLIGTDYFWVQVSLPVEQLQWIDIPGLNSDEGSLTLISHTATKNKGAGYQGRVIRLVGDIKPATRTARLLIEIADPLGLSRDRKEGKLPLLVGAWVSVQIEGRWIKNVFSIPQQAIREGDTLWIADEKDTLQVSSVTILKNQSNDTVLLSGGISDGQRIVLGRISTPIPGMNLKVEGIEKNHGPQQELKQ